MGTLLGGLLDNDSKFGRLMTRLGIIIAANVLFVLFSMPVLTIGPAYVALYHVMLKTLRGDGLLNPFKEYWRGFRSNFRQSAILWILSMAVAVFFYADFRIVMQATGLIAKVRYPLFAIAFVLLAILIYTLITMAAFADTIPHLMRNAIFFMIKNPLNIIILMFFNVFPMYLTYSDPQMMPLYAFIWVTFGFGAIAMIGASCLLPIMKPYLPLVNELGDFILDEEGHVLKPGQEDRIMADSYVAGHEPTEEETLEMMMKLGM